MSATEQSSAPAALPTVTILGAGNVAAILARTVRAAGAELQVLARDGAKAARIADGAASGTFEDRITGEVVILALPFPAYDQVVRTVADQLEGRTVVDIANPHRDATADPATSGGAASAADQLAARLPRSHVVKAFNTIIMRTIELFLAGDWQHPAPTVLMAGDDAAAKRSLAALATAAVLRPADVGGLDRARDLESLGSLQIALAASEQTSWTGGFLLLP